jgi:hypothetical protein
VSVALIGLVLILYGQVYQHQFVRFDDGDYIYGNHYVRAGLTGEGLKWAFTTNHTSNWHPLTWISHMVDCQLFGVAAGWHHLVNVVFHAANAVLLFFVLRRMTGVFWPCAFVAAVFALHPLRVESVAWASERKDVLAGLFWMLSMLAYARYVSRGGSLALIPVMVFVALGLMSKPLLVTIPFALVLLDIWPLGRWRGLDAAGVTTPARVAETLRGWTLPRLLLEKLPLLALAVASSVVTVIVQGGTTAMDWAATMSPAARLANAVVAYVAYLRMTVWPGGLACYYPHPATISSDAMAVLIGPAAISALLLIAITIAALILLRRFPYVAVGWLWYLGTMVPMIGLVQVGGQSMADRYTYIPMIGIYVALAWGARDLVMRFPRARPALAAAVAILLLITGTLTWRQIGTWKNGVALFTHALQVTDRNYMAHNNLGLDYVSLGRYDEAMAQLQHAVRAKPDLALAHYNLGVVYAMPAKENWDEAAKQFELAIQYDDDYAQAHNNLARVYDLQGKPQRAIPHYRRALESSSPPVVAAQNLAWLLATTDDPELRDGNEAVRWAEYFARVVGTNRLDSVATLAAAHAQAGNFDAAVRWQTNAIALAPEPKKEDLRFHLEEYRAGSPYRSHPGH